MEAVEEFTFQHLFEDNEEEDEDEDVTDTSGDDTEKDDSSSKKKKNHKLRNLEKLNMFMEENAPFPENLKSPTKASDTVRVDNPLNVKEDLKENAESSADEKSQHPASIVEAFKMTVGKTGASSSRTRTLDTDEMFTSSRPQESRFQYGKGMETDTITHEAMAKEEMEKDSPKKNESTGNSTDNTSSDEILKTSSSEKSSHIDHKRKKGSSSPESNVSAVKQDDKKLRYETDSSENKMCDSSDSEVANKKKE